MIDLLFTLFNAALFIGILVYVFWKHGIPFMRENILRERAHSIQLQEEQKKLAQLQHNLEQAIILQEQLAQALFKKINQWRNGVDVAAREQLEREQAFRHEADKKSMVQSKQYALKKVAHQIAPLVVEQLRNELSQQYQGNEGHAYLQRIVQDITKQ